MKSDHYNMFRFDAFFSEKKYFHKNATVRNEDASETFEVENKQDDPQLWNIEKAVDAIGKSTPAEPPVCCSAGHLLKQGVAKTGRPFYGYVCKASNKDHAKWAKDSQTAIGIFDLFVCQCRDIFLKQQVNLIL